MNSADSLDIARANTRMWQLVQRDELPWKFWLIGSMVPLLFRSVVYVLVGRLVAGAAGADWAYLGVVALAITGQTVSHVSDIPMVDVWMRTYPAVTRARLPVVVQYFSRSLVLMGRALLEAALVCVVVGPLVGATSDVLPVLLRLWMLVPAIVSATLFGLAIISVSISNDTQNLVHNAANSLLVLTSGAMLSSGAAPWLHALGSVLPLQHALAAMRGSLAGRPWLGELGLELLVALGWGLVAVVAYRVVDHRARTTGRGAMRS